MADSSDESSEGVFKKTFDRILPTLFQKSVKVKQELLCSFDGCDKAFFKASNKAIISHLTFRINKSANWEIKEFLPSFPEMNYNEQPFFHYFNTIIPFPFAKF